MSLLSLGLSGPESPNPRPPGVTFWPRVGARAIDFLPHMLAGCFAGVMVGILAGVVAVLREESPDALLSVLEKGSWHDWVFGLLGYVAYTAICEGFHGSTLGKRPLGLVVLNNESLAPCSLWQAVVRSVLFFVDSLFFGVVAYANMSGDPDQKRLGDQKARTIVLRRRDVSPDVLRSDLTFILVLAAALFVDFAILSAGFLLKMA